MEDSEFKKFQITKLHVLHVQLFFKLYTDT